MSQLKTIQDAYLPSWLPRLAVHGGPRFLQIADALQAAITDGALKPGDRLPPQRQLAAQLAVDLTTVTRAYDEARRRNLLEGRGARGTYVAAAKVELSSLLDLSMNTPPPPHGVDFAEKLKQGLSQILLHADSDLLMSYHLGGGSDADRAAGAQWLAPILPGVRADQLVTCSGAQPALAALLLCLTAPGEAIVTEAALYPGMRAAAEQLGRRVIAVEGDEHGMHPYTLEQACRKHQARVVYLNPTLQNPTARTIPEARRRELAATAQRCDAFIIEDDPYWLLADHAPAPVTLHAPERSCYIATLSKCLAPGLRTAFVLLPDAALRERFMQALRSFVLMSTPLTTALATQWIHDGTAAQLLAGIRDEARARRQLAHSLLACGSGDGIHLWLKLPGYWTSQELVRSALAEGLSIAPAAAFYATDNPPNAIRIALGSLREREHLATALRQLSELLARRPALRHQMVV